MAILLPVLPTRHMYPVVEAILRFEDQLVIVGMLLAVGHWGSQHPQLIARGNARILHRVSSPCIIANLLTDKTPRKSQQS